MVEFSLSRLRKFLQFRHALPDHPMAELDEAKALLWQLDGADPRAAVADMTNWFRSFSVYDGFTPGRRARILLLIGDTMRPQWKALAHAYLAPDDEPLEQRPGDTKLLNLMLAANIAESAAFEACFVEDAPGSRWLEENLAVVLLRWMRSLVRGATLSRMLQQPQPEGGWVKLNFAYRRACQSRVEARPISAFGQERRRSSVRQELIRGALIELASPDKLKNREIELIYRIATRFAAAVQLVSTPNPDYMYALHPETDTGPVSLKRVPEQRPGLLYFDMMNCIAQMQPFYELGRGDTATAPDARFDSEFTVRECNAMLAHALRCWGTRPPERNADRVHLTGDAKVAHGLERAQALCPLYDQGGWSADSAGEAGPDAGSQGDARDMRIEFDDKQVAQTITSAKVTREVPAKLMDASTSGLGLALAPAEARWAKVGALVCIFAESARDWVVGVIRRTRATEQFLTVGVEIICHRPQVAWLGIVANERETVWQDAVKQERNFDTHFMRAILLTDPPLEAGATGEMLLPLNRVIPGVGLEFPLADRLVRLRVREVQNAPEDYARVRVDWAPSSATRLSAGQPAVPEPIRSRATTQTAGPWGAVIADATEDAAEVTNPALPEEVAKSSAEPAAPAQAVAPDQWQLVDHDAPASPPQALHESDVPQVPAPPDQWQLVDAGEPAAAPTVPVAPKDEGGAPKDTAQPALDWPTLKPD